MVFNYSHEKYGGKNPGSRGGLVTSKCVRCGIDFTRPRWWITRALKRNKDGLLFCSLKCHHTDRHPTEEMVENISNKQKGISVLSRGREGHEVSKETKEKIRISKTGLSIVADWDLVKRVASEIGLTKYVITRAPIPDIVYHDNDQLIAIEVEKKRWATEVRKKRDLYIEHSGHGYDKVVLFWYDENSMFREKWILENGEWKQV